MSTYVYRGCAYRSKGDYDRAIADHTRAIELDPKYVSAYNNRGFAYGSKGDYNRAIADYTRAIELDPNYALAYDNRGATYKYNVKGDYDRAIADFTKAIELDPKDESARIWLLLTLRNVSKDRANRYLKEIRDYVKSNSSTEWVRTISNYYLKLEGLTEKGVLEEARRGKDDNEVRERLCEAYYHLGEERLWKGNKKGAKEYFQKSFETNVYDSHEYQAAKAALKKMKGSSK